MTDSKYESKTDKKTGHISHSIKKKAPRKSALQHAADARASAESADDLAWLTEPGPGRRQNSRQKKAGTGSIKSGAASIKNQKKYGKWAKEEAAAAHKSRSAALKANKRK